MNLISHYTSAETAINYILCKKTLRFNELKNTNDPLEYKKGITLKLDENILKLFKNYKTKDELEEHILTLKSISFTKDSKKPEEKSYFNELM